MIVIHRLSLYGLLAINAILAVAVINLGAFAKKGPRYTAADGAVERQERLHADLLLNARIDDLYNLMAEQADPAAPQGPFKGHVTPGQVQQPDQPNHPDQT